MISPDVIIKLNGASYPLAWGNLAIHRFRSIPPAQLTVVGPAQLAQIVWAGFRGVQHPFPNWEHVFAVIADLSPEEQTEIDAQVFKILPPPPPEPATEEKATPASAPEPTDAEKKSDLSKTALSPDVALG